MFYWGKTFLDIYSETVWSRSIIATLSENRFLCENCMVNPPKTKCFVKVDPLWLTTPKQVSSPVHPFVEGG